MCAALLIHTALDRGFYKMVRTEVESTHGSHANLAHALGFKIRGSVLWVPSSNEHVSEHLATCSRTLV